jgi:CheY-like chemotaxis protein
MALKQPKLSVMSVQKFSAITYQLNAMTGDRDKCIKIGMNDYMSKPVKKNELAEMLDKWVNCEESGEKI